MSITRLMRLLAIFAMLFAPFGMIGGHAAMAMPAATSAMPDHASMMDPASHCADREEPSKDRPGSSIDCMIACSALPSAESGVGDQTLPVALVLVFPRATGVAGLHPESDPPPPRLS